MLNPNISLKQGDCIPLQIEKLVQEGAGMGYYQGRVIFVPGAAPGDELEVRIIRCPKDYAWAQIRRILKPSSYRVKPLCPHFLRCGGCDWQHIRYDVQLAAKKELVNEALTRIGKLRDISVGETIPAKKTYHWRNKIIQPIITRKGRVISGFYREGTHEVVGISRCFLQHPLSENVIEKVKTLIEKYQLPICRQNSRLGYLRYLMVRVGVHSQEAMLVFITRGNKISSSLAKEEGTGGYFSLKDLAQQLKSRIPELVSIYQNINNRPGNVILGEEMRLLDGKETIAEMLNEIHFSISPDSFFQVNTEQAEILYRLVKEATELKEDETVIDAYCGIGPIALFLARQAKKVYGIEEDISAVENAYRNARLNHIDNCTFIPGKVEEALPALLFQGLKPAVIILDPPRKGCSSGVLQTMIQLRPRRIIYVSCNPSTLARDLDILSKMGYSLLSVQPIDLFPQTYHVECIAVLEKNNT